MACVRALVLTVKILVAFITVPVLCAIDLVCALLEHKGLQPPQSWRYAEAIVAMIILVSFQLLIGWDTTIIRNCIQFLYQCPPFSSPTLAANLLCIESNL